MAECRKMKNLSSHLGIYYGSYISGGWTSCFWWKQTEEIRELFVFFFFLYTPVIAFSPTLSSFTATPNASIQGLNSALMLSSVLLLFNYDLQRGLHWSPKHEPGRVSGHGGHYFLVKNPLDNRRGASDCLSVYNRKKQVSLKVKHRVWLTIISSKIRQCSANGLDATRFNVAK